MKENKMKKDRQTIVVSNLLEWAAPAAFTDNPKDRQGKWFIERGVWGSTSGMLISTRDQAVPELRFNPGLTGWYDVRVRLYHWGYTQKHAVYNVRAGTSKDRALRILRSQQQIEDYEVLSLGPREMAGAEIRLDASYQCCWIDSVQMVPCAPPKPLPPAEKEVCGILDIPDSVDDYRPMEQGAAECVRAHAEAGFTTIFWRAFGVCCEYPSKIGQVRTPDQDGNGRMCIGRHLEKYDILAAAADEAKKTGVKLLGWMRMNNEFSVPTGHFSGTTPFHKAHPEMRERNKNGSLHPRLSFAYPEVRQYLCALGREILDRGTAGLMIDVMRHPPMARYDKPLVDAFLAKTGKNPMEMEGDGTEEWLRFKATAFTDLLRDFRKMMDASGHKGKPIYVRAMMHPWRLLRDGCDVEAWMREKLVDTFVADDGLDSTCFDLAPIRQLIHGRARLIALVMGCSGIEAALALARMSFDQGADGTAIYESNYTVTYPGQRDAVHKLRYSALK